MLEWNWMDVVPSVSVELERTELELTPVMIDSSVLLFYLADGFRMWLLIIQRTCGLRTVKLYLRRPRCSERIGDHLIGLYERENAFQTKSYQALDTVGICP